MTPYILQSGYLQQIFNFCYEYVHTLMHTSWLLLFLLIFLHTICQQRPNNALERTLSSE